MVYCTDMTPVKLETGGIDDTGQDLHPIRMQTTRKWTGQGDHHYSLHSIPDPKDALVEALLL